jgi:hypothetical protein
VVVGMVSATGFLTVSLAQGTRPSGQVSSKLPEAMLACAAAVWKEPSQGAQMIEKALPV